MRVDQSLSSEGGGEEREGKEVTSGSQWKLEDCIQIPCGIPRLSKTDLEIHRFLGCFGFSSMLCCFFYLMLQLFGHQIYCAPCNNCIYFRTRLKRTILKGFKRF